MELLEAVKARHSVRCFTDQKIDGAVLDALRQTVAACNQDGGLHIQLCVNEPNAFSGAIARYGRFRNVKNYIALVAKKGAAFEEACGYYGEKIVIQAQQLGLNTCWVGLNYSKDKSKDAIEIGPEEALLLVIALGYGETGGVPRKSKPLEALCRVNGAMPEWFRRGMEAVMLAPTAVNQQNFRFELIGNQVKASAGRGFYPHVGLGIAKYHFEIGAGKDGWAWA